MVSPPTSSSVAPNSIFDIQFNTPLDPTTVNGTNIYLVDETTGLHVPGTYSAPQQNVVRFVPSGDLTHNGVLYIQPGLHSSTSVPAQSNAWWYYPTGSDDTTLPLIMSAVPYNGAGNVGVNVAPGVVFSKAIDPVSANSGESIPPNSAITVQFSESMDVTTLSDSNFFIQDQFLGGHIPATFSWSVDQSTAYPVPASPLAAGRQYYFYVYNGTDLAGNQVQGTSFSFYAQYAAASTAPTVINWNPLPGASGLGTNVIIEAQFSAPIGNITLATGGATMPTTPSLEAGNTVLQLVPQKPLLPGGNHTMTVAGVKDPAGNLVATVTNSFTVGATFDISGLSVINYDPPYNATVGTNVVPKMVFNKPLDPITVSNSTFRMYLNDTGQWIPLTVTPSARPDRDVAAADSADSQYPLPLPGLLQLPGSGR